MIIKDSAKIADVSTLDGIVVLYASAFGNRDAHGDTIVKGAYAKTIQERGPAGSNRIKHLNMHDWMQMLGVPLELSEDANGLRVVSKVSKTTLGQDVLKLYQDGVITEHSVGIDILRRDDTDQSLCLECRLWEYSSVTWGANPKTPTIDVKSITGHAGVVEVATPLAVQIQNASRALNTGVSDELASTIEKWLDSVQGQPRIEDDAPNQQLGNQIANLAILSQILSMNKQVEKCLKSLKN